MVAAGRDSSPLADFIKLLTKEDIEPRDAKKTIFKFAPLLAFTIMIFALFFLPVDGTNIFSTGVLARFNCHFTLLNNRELFCCSLQVGISNPYGTIVQQEY